MDNNRAIGRFTVTNALRILTAITLLGGISIVHGQEWTYAERLGWPAGTRAVIFHVDDAGMSHDSNVGARKAIEDGVGTSLSVMMPCSWVPECAAWLKANPKIDAGIHLTLTSEWKHYRWGPVAGRSVVPGLVDEQGYLYHDVAGVLAHATPDELITLLREMKPGITEIIVHCTEPTETFSHISGSGAARQAELRLMTDPEVKSFIESEGIVLTNWRELKERRQHVGK